MRSRMHENGRRRNAFPCLGTEIISHLNAGRVTPWLVQVLTRADSTRRETPDESEQPRIDSSNQPGSFALASG